MNKRILIIIFILLPFLFTLPILKTGNLLGIQDWDHFLSQMEFARKSLVEYKQFPFWNPYLCGGFNNTAFPESNYLSIFLPFILLFGTIFGVKIGIFVHYVIGFVGFFFLAKYLKLTIRASLICSLVFSFSGVISSAIGAGMTNLIYFFYLPLIVLFFLKTCQENRGVFKNIIFTSFLLSLITYADFHILIYIVPNLFIISLFFSLKTKRVKPLINLLITIIILVILSLPKIILWSQIYTNLNNNHVDVSGYPLGLIFYFLIVPIQFYHKHFKSIYYGNDENSLYVGIVFFLFVILGLFNKKKPFLLFFLLFFNFWMVLGNRPFFNLWVLAQNIPYLKFIRVAQRFRYFFIIPLVLIGGYGFDDFSKKVGLNLMQFLFIFILIFIDLFLFTYINFYSMSFNFTYYFADSVRSNRISRFYQVSNFVDYFNVNYDFIDNSQSNFREYQPWSDQFIATYYGVGEINCSIKPYLNNLSSNIKEVGSNNYRGEWYLLNKNGELTLQYWSPNKINFLVTNLKDKDLIIINQNYDPNWIVTLGNVNIPTKSYNGLLSAVVTSSGKITFTYVPYKIFKKRL